MICKLAMKWYLMLQLTVSFRVIARMHTPKYGEILRDTNGYKQINDTLFRQRITAGSGTDSSD